MSMQKIENRSQALAFLRKELSEGSTLAKLVLRRTDFEHGGFFTGIPENIDQNQLDFRSSIGGLSREPMAFARLIKAFISRPDYAVLLEDTEPLTSDLLKVDSKYRTRIRTYKGSALFWSMSGSDLSESDIFTLLGMPILPYPSSAFFHLAGTSKANTELTDSDLERIANGLVGAAVRAFDTRSVLIWWREDLHPFPDVGTT
jgi:hypothetical protein